MVECFFISKDAVNRVEWEFSVHSDECKHE